MDLSLLQLIILLASSQDEDLGSPHLSRKIRDGDQKAFKAFFNSHHDELYYFLLKKGVAEQLAEDLIQQAFVYIWEHRDTIDENKSLRAYLFRIAYSRMLNAFRDHKKFNREAEITGSQSPENTDHNLQQEELNRAINTAISSLPEKRQEVFRLCFIQEFTYKEAAEFLEVSVKTIENHMGLALKDLRNSLHKFL